MNFKIEEVSLEDIEAMDEIKEIIKSYIEKTIKDKKFESIGAEMKLAKLHLNKLYGRANIMKAELVYQSKREVITLERRPIKKDETFDTKVTPSLFECALCHWECNDTTDCDEIKYCPGCGRRIVKIYVVEDTEEGDSDEK